MRNSLILSSAVPFASFPAEIKNKLEIQLMRAERK
jgi:hypothetical protein